MTEINKNLSVNGVNFEGLKKSKKAKGEESTPKKGAETDKTDLDKMPGATYGRVGIKKARGKYNLPPETEECVKETTNNFMKHPDIHVIAEMVFKNTYDNAIAEGHSKEEAYSIALEAKGEYLDEVSGH